MNQSRFVLTLVFMIVLLLTTVAIVSGGQEKVDVCHITGTHDFGDGQGEVPIGHVINIAAPAYNAHIEHGDPPAFMEVQLPDGTIVCKANEGKIVFITSKCWQGDFGNVQIADSYCQTAAETGGLASAGEPQFKAWLSDSINHAKDHALDSSYQGMYVKPNGMMIALNNDDLLDGSISSEIDINEFNILVPHDRSVWTGTDGDGTISRDGNTCNDWRSPAPHFGSLGYLGMTWNGEWSHFAESDCNYCSHFYCFQQ